VEGSSLRLWLRRDTSVSGPGRVWEHWIVVGVEIASSLALLAMTVVKGAG
jgi:hypothetical protein